MLHALLPRSPKYILLLGILIGIALRLVFIVSFVGNYDQASYQIVADIMQSGRNVYAETSRYNYSPVWMYILHSLNSIALFINVPLHIAVRFTLVLVELAVLMILVNIFHIKVSGSVHQRALIYYLNPGVILLIGYHGQFEILALLPIMLLVLLQVRRSNNILWTLLLTSIATIIKHNSLFILWPLLYYFHGWKRGVIVSLVSIVMLLLSLVLYIEFWDSNAGIVSNVLLYTSIDSLFGLSWLLPDVIQLPIMMGVVGITPFVVKHLNSKMRFSQYWVICTLAWYSVISGFGLQYMMFFFAVASLMNISRWTFVLGLGTAIGEIGYILQKPPVVKMSIFVTGLLCLACLGFVIKQGVHVEKKMI